MKLGWLSPQGDFYECHSYDHVAAAEEIISKVGIVVLDKLRQPDDILLDVGYAKLGISSLGEKRYYVIWNRRLTPYQRYFLKDIIENENPEMSIDAHTLTKWKYEEDLSNEN